MTVSLNLTGMGGQDDHHAEEAYRAMTSSLVQAQQGAKDLVEVANRLQDRFFCVYLHNPSAKVKAVEDDGIMVESATMRDRMSFAEVCLRHHLRFNVAEASAKSSRVLIGMISAEQQDSADGQPPVAALPREGSGSVPSSSAAGSNEEARQRAAVSVGYIEGEQEIMGSFLGAPGQDGSRAGGGNGRGRGAMGHERPGGAVPVSSRRQAEYELYREMESMHSRGMGSMAGGMHGAHPSEIAASYYGYHGHMDAMMASGYHPSHRMPYGGMNAGFIPDMYPGAMEDMKHAKHAMGMPHAMGSHVHAADVRWAGVPRGGMPGRGVWHHPAAARDAMRSMGMAGRFRDGVDPRMLDAHGFGYDPSYAGHVGPSPHMPPTSQEMHMLHAMAGGAGAWGGVMPGGVPRKVFPLTSVDRACVLTCVPVADMPRGKEPRCDGLSDGCRGVAASRERCVRGGRAWRAGSSRGSSWKGRQCEAASKPGRWRWARCGNVTWSSDAGLWRRFSVSLSRAPMCMYVDGVQARDEGCSMQLQHRLQNEAAHV